MVNETLQDFTINWVITGFLLTCLIAFAVTFMYNNNPLGLGNDGDTVFGDAYDGLSGQLLQSADSSDVLLNITSNTNPEVSTLGSRDVVSTSFGAKGSASAYFESAKNLLAWVFSGAIGKMLLAVFGGIMGFLAYFFIIKHIRIGT